MKGSAARFAVYSGHGESSISSSADFRHLFTLLGARAVHERGTVVRRTRRLRHRPIYLNDLLEVVVCSIRTQFSFRSCIVFLRISACHTTSRRLSVICSVYSVRCTEVVVFSGVDESPINAALQFVADIPQTPGADLLYAYT